MAGQGTQPPASPVTALLRGAREPEGSALSSQPAEGARGLWKGCRHPAGRTFMKTNSLGRIRRGLSNSDKVGSLKGKLTNLNGCVLIQASPFICCVTPFGHRPLMGSLISKVRGETSRCKDTPSPTFSSFLGPA